MTRRRQAPSRLLLITRDPARGVGLLRGPAASRAAWLLSPDEDPPRWSATAGGWVVTLRVADDATGWAQATGALVRVSTLTAAHHARTTTTTHPERTPA